MRKLILTLFLGVGLLAAVRAQVAFTITGTATNTDFGYIEGNTYTFTYVTSPGVSDNSTSYFDATHNYWREFHVPEDQLYGSVSGDGLAGVFTKPVFGDTDPRSFIQVRQTATPGSDFLEMSAASQHSDIGLSMNGYDVNIVYFQWADTGVSFHYPGSFSEPATAFASDFGTYFPALGTSSLTIYSTDYNFISFTTTSVTIGAASAIPEPSTYALLAGLGALGLTRWRRRGRER